MSNLSLKINHLFSVILLAILSACSAIPSKEQCQTYDWQQQGFSDGRHGKPPESYLSIANACKEHGIEINAFDVYKAGWAQGNQMYCNPSNGYSTGANGLGYTGVCRDHDEAGFLNAYFQGLSSYNINTKFDQMSRETAQLKSSLLASIDQQAAAINHLQHRLEKLEKELAHLKDNRKMNAETNH